MRPSAGTPEDLATLLEDAVVMRDAASVTSLFASDGILVNDRGDESRGHASIRSAAERMWDNGYVADVRRVVQVRNIALVVGNFSAAVVRRNERGGWLYLIALVRSEQV